MQRLKHFWQRTPLAAQTVGMIILASSMITLLAIVLLLLREFHSGVAHLQRNLDQARLSMVPSISNALWQFDEGSLQTQMDSLMQLPEVSGVRVSWTDWNGAPRHLEAGELDTITAGPWLHQFPLVYRRTDGRAEQLGQLQIQTSPASIYHQVIRHGLFIVLFQGMKTFLLATIILLILRRLGSRHLARVADYARNLRLESLHRPLELERPHRRDELQDIVDAINQMRSSLQQDIRDREAAELTLKQLEEDHRQQEQRLQRVEQDNQNQRRFLASMGHEIRTPLNGVVGFIELLGNTSLDPQQRRYLELLQHSSDNLAALLNDILDYSQLEQQPLVLDPAPVDLQRLVEEAVSGLAMVAHHQQLELLMDLRLRHHRHVQGDALRIRQVLLNLLNQILRLRTPGEATVQVNADQTSQQVDVRIQACFRDDPSQPLARLGSCGDGEDPRRMSPANLGLALCQRLVQAMGGQLRVRHDGLRRLCLSFSLPLPASPCATSPPPLPCGTPVLVLSREPALRDALRGMLEHLEARVTASDQPGCLHEMPSRSLVLVEAMLIDTLPPIPPDLTLVPLRHLDQCTGSEPGMLRPVTLSALEQLLLDPTPFTRTPPLSGPLEGLLRLDQVRVLMAEDDPVSRNVLQAILASLQIRPLVCASGEQAVEQYCAQPEAVDLILMDCEMPGMDGFEATRRIREHERLHGLNAVPVVALTAHDQHGLRQPLIQAGMTSLITKPVRMETLRQLLVELGVHRRLTPGPLRSLPRP